MLLGQMRLELIGLGHMVSGSYYFSLIFTYFISFDIYISFFYLDIDTITSAILFVFVC